MACLINEMFYLKFIVLYSGNSQWPLTTVKELDWATMAKGKEAPTPW